MRMFAETRTLVPLRKACRHDRDHYGRIFRSLAFVDCTLSLKLPRRKSYTKSSCVVENRREDFHHLAIAVGGAGEFAADFLHRRRQNPILERRAVPQGARRGWRAGSTRRTARSSWNLPAPPFAPCRAAVQAKLAERAVQRKLTQSRSPSILAGLIFDDRGNPMSPSHANKKGVRYRYYVSQALLQSRMPLCPNA